MSIFDDAIFDDDEILEPDEDMDASEELVDWKTKIAEARRLAMSAMLFDEECEKRIHCSTCAHMGLTSPVRYPDESWRSASDIRVTDI